MSRYAVCYIAKALGSQALSRIATAAACFSVWLRLMWQFVIRAASSDSPLPWSTTKGSPDSFRQISMSCHPNCAPTPVPNALEIASLPANRAARNGPGDLCEKQYANSAGRRILWTNRSPNFAKAASMRSTSMMFDAGAENQVESILRLFAAHLLHCQQHLADGVGKPHHHGAAMMLWPMFNSTRCGTCRNAARF